MNPELVTLIALSQRALSNVAAYVSVSLGLLAYSRAYRDKGNAVYNLAFIVISAVALSLSVRLLHLLLHQLSLYRCKLSDEDAQVLDDFATVPRALLVLLYVILCFSFFTLRRELKLRSAEDS